MYKIKNGTLLRHFKGNLYIVLDVAKHSETLEDYVIYARFDSDIISCETWVRPMSMFFDVIDDVGTTRFTYEGEKDDFQKIQ